MSVAANLWPLAQQRPLFRVRGMTKGLGHEGVIVALVTALIGAVYVSLGRFGFDLLEEGYFLASARRVQLGEVPYRDFAAPYTPGVFYLYAWIMDWTSGDVVPLRWLQVGARALLFLGLYATGRQLMRPAFAALTPLLLLAMDSAPELWGIHPGWYAAAASVLSVLAVARYLSHGRTAALLLAGLALGVAFAFKQNVAIFGMMATLWMLVALDARLPLVEARWLAGLVGRLDQTGMLVYGLAVLRRVLQALAFVLLPAAAAALIRPNASLFPATFFVVPLAALSVMMVARSRGATRRFLQVDRRPGAAVREVSFYIRPVLVLIGFAVVTLPWMAVLVYALDGQIGLLGAFIGKVDTAGYFLPMDPLSALERGLLGALLILCWLVRRPVGSGGRWERRLLAATIGCFVGLAFARITLPHVWPLVRWGAAGPYWSAYAGVPSYLGAEFFLHLPIPAFWGAFAIWVWHRPGRHRHETVAALAAPERHVGQPAGIQETRRNLTRLWYLVAGSALLLQHYPRMDDIHLLWSGGVLLVAGADALHALCCRLMAHLSAAAGPAAGKLIAALLIALVPCVAASYHVRERLVNVEAAIVPWSTPARVSDLDQRGPFAPLMLPNQAGSIYAPVDQVQPITDVVEFLKEHTAADEPIFAYPGIPGFYYLADRPNATRHNHLFSGMISSRDEVEIIADLARVRYIVWDDRGASYWASPSDSPGMREYIWTHFRVERAFGIYTVLARSADSSPAADSRRRAGV